MARAVHPNITTPNQSLRIRRSSSAKTDPALAVAQLHSELVGDSETGLILLFVSNRYDHQALARELQGAFAGTRLIGCTTAGEIGPLGYMEGGLSGVFLSGGDFVFEAGLIEQVSQLEARAIESFAYKIRERLAERVSEFDPSHCFALLLIDGLCGHEEIVARAVHDGLGGIRMVGGSAGDGLNFQETAVLFDGRFHPDSAVLLVAATSLPFTTFKTQHFLSAPRRLVVTGAIPERRIVTEINGFAAAAEYARVVGEAVSKLTPKVFSAYPMMVRIGGADFIRSIQKANPDGSLKFFCAIDEGIVFNVAERLDFEHNLNTLFDNIEQNVGPPQLVIGCDCILRRLELVQNGRLDSVSAILREHNVIGFNSYGEQYSGIHVNQTFTGIAIGGEGARHG